METIPDEFPKLNTDSDDINDWLIILKETHHVPPILNSKTKNGIMAQFANKYSTNEHFLWMNRVESDLTESKQLNHSFLCKPNQTHRWLAQSEKIKDSKWWWKSAWKGVCFTVKSDSLTKNSRNFIPNHS